MTRLGDRALYGLPQGVLRAVEFGGGSRLEDYGI